MGSRQDTEEMITALREGVHGLHLARMALVGEARALRLAGRKAEREKVWARVEELTAQIEVSNRELAEMMARAGQGEKEDGGGRKEVENAQRPTPDARRPTESGAAKVVREIAGDADFGMRNPVQSAAMLFRILNNAERYLEEVAHG